MNDFVKTAREIGDGYSVTCQYPDVATDDNGNTYVVYQMADMKGHEQAYLVSYSKGEEHFLGFFSGSGLALKPRALFSNGVLYLAWAENENRKWKICFRTYSSGSFGRLCIVEEGECLCYPSLCSDGKDILLLYTREMVGKSEIRVARISGDKFLSVETLSECKKAYRPSAASDNNGNLILAYDSFNGDAYDVVLRTRIAGKWSDEIVCLSQKGRYATFACASFDGKNFIICWFEISDHSYYCYKAATIEIHDSNIKVKDTKLFTENKRWYNNCDSASNLNGYTAFVYTIGKDNCFIRVRTPEGNWSKAVLLGFDNHTVGVRPMVDIDNDNNIHYAWQWANTNGHQQRMAKIIYDCIPVDAILSLDDSALENKIDSFCYPIETPKVLDKVQDEEKQKWLKDHGYDCKLLFGDIHGQSIMSDGMGEMDQYYHYAMTKADMDFSALTDHDCYPDVATPSEWEWNRATRNIFNGEKNFAVLLAYEWTSNEYKHDFGHKNVYYPSSDGGLYTSLDMRSMDPDRLYKALKEDGGLCIPHHPAADWTIVSAGTDWDYYDQEVQPVTEIFSRHADYEKYDAISKYTKNVKKFKHKCIQDALERGYRFSFIAGSDSHQMEHGVEGGITAVFVKNQSSEDVWNALKNRHTYATTGARILLCFRINGIEMGQELSTSGERKIEIGAYAVNDIRKIEIVKNNKILKTFNPSNRIVDLSFVDDPSSESDYYYVRLEQVDDHIAWASPIWVN